MAVSHGNLPFQEQIDNLQGRIKDFNLGRCGNTRVSRNYFEKFAFIWKTYSCHRPMPALKPNGAVA